jgi:WD40 repeat protein
MMVTGSFNAAKLWRVDSQMNPTCVATLYGQSSSNFSAVGFHPIHPIMATAAAVGNDLVLWRISFDGSNGCMLTRLADLSGHTRDIRAVSFHNTLPFIASGSFDSTTKLWELEDEAPYARLVASFEIDDCVFSIDFHPNKPLLATAGRSNDVSLWRLPTENSPAGCMARWKAHENWVYSVAFHPTAPIFATASQDWTIKLWMLPEAGLDPHCLATITGHTDGVNSVTFHKNEPFMVSTSMDRTVRVWRLSRDFSSATCIATLEHNGTIVICAEFNASTLVMGCRDSSLILRK